MELHWPVYWAVRCTGWSNCSQFKIILSGMDVLLVMSFFQLYPRLTLSFEHNSARKKVFLCACFCWDVTHFSVRWTKKLSLVEPLVIVTRSCSFFSSFPQMFELLAILHNAAGAVRAHSSKEPAYCYMTGRGP